jgi:alpha-tubulin suppressor-like RCC1 family protein
MAIVYNNKQIQHAYYGETPIHQIYLGDQLKWADAGCLFSCGLNTNGQLGTGDNTQYKIFTQAGILGNWLKIDSGLYFSLAINSIGELYAWGANAGGQLGQNNTTNLNTPTKIGSATNWVKIACGGANGAGNSFAINSSGELHGCGKNEDGSLGLGVTVGSYHVLTRIGEASNWIEVAGGGCFTDPNYIPTYSAHSLAINSYGELYACGTNQYGQLGLGDTTLRNVFTRVGEADNWVKASCGGLHSAAINSSGELYAWGHNVEGQLGQGNTSNSTIPVRAGSASNWVDVACGRYHTIALNSSGELYSCGYNMSGQLGQGSTTRLTTLTKIGSATNWVKVATKHEHVVAYNSANELYTWGEGGSGQLGFDSTTDKTVPTLVGTYSTIFDVSAGQFHSSIIKL